MVTHSFPVLYKFVHRVLSNIGLLTSVGPSLVPVNMFYLVQYTSKLQKNAIWEDPGGGARAVTLAHGLYYTHTLKV